MIHVWKKALREGNGMYRILLVDDEWLELDTLEKYIPWEEMGFQVAGTAENGKEALQLLAVSYTHLDVYKRQGPHRLPQPWTYKTAYPYPLRYPP